MLEYTTPVEARHSDMCMGHMHRASGMMPACAAMHCCEAQTTCCRAAGCIMGTKEASQLQQLCGWLAQLDALHKPISNTG